MHELVFIETYITDYMTLFKQVGSILEWMPWGKWGECDATCPNYIGTRSRERTCNNTCGDCNEEDNLASLAHCQELYPGERWEISESCTNPGPCGRLGFSLLLIGT